MGFYKHPDETCLGLQGRVWSVIWLMVGGFLIVAGDRAIFTDAGTIELIGGCIITLSALLYAAIPAKLD